MRWTGLHLFEGGGIPEQAYQYLLSIPPTSIEAERAFSAAGYIGNKIRSQLGDDTLDALLFLRVHFQNTSYWFTDITYTYSDCFFILKNDFNLCLFTLNKDLEF